MNGKGDGRSPVRLAAGLALGALLLAALASPFIMGQTGPWRYVPPGSVEKVAAKPAPPKVKSALYVEASGEAADVKGLEGRLRDDIERTVGRGLPGGLSRTAGSERAREIARETAEQFRALGMSPVVIQKFPVVAPVTGRSGLSLGGVLYRIHPLMPNVARTCTIGNQDNTLTGPVVWGGTGELRNLRGVDVQGSILVLDDDRGQDWVVAGALGPGAIVFVEPDEPRKLQLDQKVLGCALDMPRFWIGREDGLRLRKQLQDGKEAGDGRGVLSCRVDWKENEAYNVYGLLPGTCGNAADGRARDITVVLSHLDSTSLVPDLAPGAEGAASLAASMELARRLSVARPERSVLFAVSGAHYPGMLGEKHMTELLRRNPVKLVEEIASVDARLLGQDARAVLLAAGQEVSGLAPWQKGLLYLIGAGLLLVAGVSIKVFGLSLRSSLKLSAITVAVGACLLSGLGFWLGMPRKAEPAAAAAGSSDELAAAGGYGPLRSVVGRLALAAPQDAGRMVALIGAQEEAERAAIVARGELSSLLGGWGGVDVSADWRAEFDRRARALHERAGLATGYPAFICSLFRELAVAVGCPRESLPAGSSVDEQVRIEQMLGQRISAQRTVNPALFRSATACREAVAEVENRQKREGASRLFYLRLTGYAAFLAELGPSVPERVHSCVGFDLTSRGDRLAAFFKGSHVNQFLGASEKGLQDAVAPLCEYISEIGSAEARALGFTSATVAGGDSWNYLQNTTESIGGVEWGVLAPAGPYFGAEIFTLAGFPSVTLATVQDARPLLNTPLDLPKPEFMDFARLARQVEIACRALAGAVHAGAGRLAAWEVRDWRGLAARLTGPEAGAPSRHLRGLLAPEAVRLLEAVAGGGQEANAEVCRALSEALDGVLNSDGLYSAAAFAGVDMHGEVANLRDRADHGRLPQAERRRFNRLLAEHVLPEITRLAGRERGILALERTESGCGFKLGANCLRAHGEVLEFNPGKSTTLSSIAVPGAVVFNRKEPLSTRGAIRPLTTPVRPDTMALADRYGAFEFFGLATANVRVWGDGEERMEAFDVSPATGEIIKAPVNGPRGGQYGLHWRAPKLNDDRFPLGLFACQSLNLLDISDLRGFGAQESQFTFVTTYLGAADSVPIKMGWSGMGDTSMFAYPEHALVVFCERRETLGAEGDGAGGRDRSNIVPQHLKVTLGRPKLAGVKWPILGIAPEGRRGASPTGEGLPVLWSSFVLDPDSLGVEFPENAGTAAAGGRIIPPIVIMAQDLHRLDMHRLAVLEKAGVKNPAVVAQHEAAGRELEACRLAKEEKRWDDMVVHARNSWGYESRAYPSVQGTVTDVVQGLLFYLFLMLPFAYFMERLFLCYPDINRQLAGVFGMFMAFFAVLYVVHPAFGITSAAPMILLAFITLALALLVMGMVTTRFSRELEAMQKRPGRGGSRKTDMDRFNAAISAFLLGINNMRRRKVRTTLTMVTLVLLTFSVLSFSSIESSFGVNKRMLSGGSRPPYEGVLVRGESWLRLDEMAARILRDEFFGAGQCVVSPRAWSTGRNVCPVGMPENGFSVPGMLGVRPVEQSVTGLGLPGTLVTGRMFKPHEARERLPVCLLDVELMKKLGLDAGLVRRGEDILDLTDPANRQGLPRVSINGEELTVIGVLRTESYSDTVDIDGERIVPVDTEVETWERSRGQTAGSQQLEFRQYQHVEAWRVPVVPYDWLMVRGGALQSVALKPSDPATIAPMVEEKLLRRLSVPMFVATRDDAGELRTVFMSAAIGSKVSGVGSLLVPMLIAALIVLNTMLGSVYEREREISIYGSLGLAPVHIGSLFIAESAVYAVVSAVLGYILGQSVSKLVVLGGAEGLLAGFSLNYSSLSAVFSACFIIIVVMLSAAYPAVRAGQLSVPDVERIWKFPRPEGDRLIFLFPFTVSGEQGLGVNVHIKHFFDDHANQSVGEFYTADTRFGYLEKRSGGGSSYRLASRVWIAPFDFGISQMLELDTVLAEGETDIYETRLVLTRLSGAPEAWVKMNHRFMKSMRKQFLLWRMFTNEERAWHVAQAKGLLGEAAAPAVAAAAPGAGAGGACEAPQAG
jgi:hypothetical protein